MTIQRQYSRPNCKLVLEGPADSNGSAGAAKADAASLLISNVTNVECHFAGHDKPLTGGQELLDGLVHTVSSYVQEVLSGITRPEASKTQSVARVQLQPLGQDLHRLTVNQAANESDPSKYQIDLKTIQLFDLVETVDQLVADGQTLPALAVDLSPLPRRYAATQEPAAAKVMPAAIGVSSLAAAAIALFLLPVPEVMPPEVDPRPRIEEQTEGPGLESNTDGPGSAEPSAPEDLSEPTTDSGLSESSEPIAVETGESSNASDSDAVGTGTSDSNSSATATLSDAPGTETPTDGETVQNSGDTVEQTSVATNLDSESVAAVDAIVNSDRPSGAAQLPDAEEIDQILGTAQPIADPDKLNELTLSLRDRVDRAWDRPESMDEDLIYRVGMSESGDMVGFKAINDPATKFIDTVPLKQLDTVPVSAADSFQASIGQFRVVFRTTGVVEVSPWYGRLPEPDEEF